MQSSGVWAGAIPIEKAHALKEVGPGGATLRSELERIGYLGSVPASHTSMPMAAHFELHIEQGPIVDGSGQKIGVVRGVQAYKWFTIEVQGRGAFPFFPPSPVCVPEWNLTQEDRLAHRYYPLLSSQ